MRDLNVLWLWPSVLNLHGDRGNVMALKRWGDAMGVTVNLHRVEKLTDPIDFDYANVILFLPGQLKEMPLVIRRLQRDKKSLEAYLQRGGLILTVGTTGCVFAHETTRLDGTAFSGLGLLPMCCVERDHVYGNDLVFEVGGKTSAGSQIQIIDTILDVPEEDRFAEVIYGRGNNGGKDEGCRAGNLIFTNVLGPMLVKNPWLTTDLIAQATGVKAPDNLDFQLEEQSLAAVTAFNQNKHQEA